MIASPEEKKYAPIGVFDSGLGGLSVVRRLRECLPQEPILYVADQANVPYGGRELPEVCGFACSISEALFAAGCKALVMACNISSATALRIVQADYPAVPVLGMIQSGVRLAAAQTRNGRIGVLATEGTVKSRAYSRALNKLDSRLEVSEVACPAFVPLVEVGEAATPAARTAAREYLEPLLQAGVDTVILGCTHYPFLLPVLSEAAPALRFVDPAEPVARDLADELSATGLLPPADRQPRHLLTTTGDVAVFAEQCAQLLPELTSEANFAPAAWQDRRLRIYTPSPS